MLNFKCIHIILNFFLILNSEWNRHKSLRLPIVIQLVYSTYRGTIRNMHSFKLNTIELHMHTSPFNMWKKIMRLL